MIGNQITLTQIQSAQIIQVGQGLEGAIRQTPAPPESQGLQRRQVSHVQQSFVRQAPTMFQRQGMQTMGWFQYDQSSALEGVEDGGALVGVPQLDPDEAILSSFSGDGLLAAFFS